MSVKSGQRSVRYATYAGSVLGSSETVTDRGIGVALGDLLVGLLAGLGALALNRLGNVVGGISDRVGDLADDALVGLIDVGCRHFGWLWRGAIGVDGLLDGGRMKADVCANRIIREQ